MMFSARLAWDVPPNRISLLLEEKRRSGAPIFDLTESNPTRAGFAYPEAEVRSALADPRSLLYEPAPAGSPEARAAVADYYTAHGLEVAPERILLTASTSESYAFLFKLLAEPGDEILVPRPSYPLFEYLAALESVRVARYPIVYHGGWEVDFDALEAAIGSRTRAVVVVNPNNPTGSFLKRDEAERLTALCAARDLAIVSDEVFSDYAFTPDDPRRAATLTGVEAALAFSLSGLSKTAGLPQMKLGWIVVGGPAELRRRAFERLELIADTYLSVAAPVQHALPRLLEAGVAVRRQIAERTRRNLDCLVAAVRNTPACAALQVEGGWYAVLRVPRTRSEEDLALALLSEANVLAQPGYFYDFESEAYLIVSLLTPPDTFREGLRRILDFV